MTYKVLGKPNSGKRSYNGADSSKWITLFIYRGQQKPGYKFHKVYGSQTWFPNSSKCLSFIVESWLLVKLTQNTANRILWIILLTCTRASTKYNLLQIDTHTSTLNRFTIRFILAVDGPQCMPLSIHLELGILKISSSTQRRCFECVAL